MTDDMNYERTEYDRISPAVAARYERISRERGRTVVPLDAFGRDASGERPNSYRVEINSPGVDEDLDAAGADGDSPVGDRSGLGWFGGRGTDDE